MSIVYILVNNGGANYLLFKIFKMRLEICLSIAQVEFFPDIFSVDIY